MRYPEPFEKIRSRLIAEANSPYEVKYPHRQGELKSVTGNVEYGRQMELFSEDAEKESSEKTEQKLLDTKSRRRHKLIGQVFETYWLVEFDEKLFIIDQHAAHEKVMYERFMADLRTKRQTSQMITPAVIVTLNMQEEELLEAASRSLYFGRFRDLALWRTGLCDQRSAGKSLRDRRSDAFYRAA